jgi:hypothetical protein
MLSTNDVVLPDLKNQQAGSGLMMCRAAGTKSTIFKFRFKGLWS